METFKENGLGFRIIGYVNGDAELIVNKFIQTNTPSQRIKISGGTFTSSYIPYYGGDVYVKMESEDDVSGFVYVMVLYY